MLDVGSAIGLRWVWAGKRDKRAKIRWCSSGIYWKRGCSSVYRGTKRVGECGIRMILEQRKRAVVQVREGS